MPKPQKAAKLAIVPQSVVAADPLASGDVRAYDEPGREPPEWAEQDRQRDAASATADAPDLYAAHNDNVPNADQVLMRGPDGSTNCIHKDSVDIMEDFGWSVVKLKGKK